MNHAARMRSVAWLLMPGLAIQGLSLFWVHPLSFILFLVGALPTVAGMLLALFFLVRGTEATRSSGPS